ncbi:MAG: hypothetical protein Q4Q03_00660 [Bowdeniella nasicola]|nr:hypothetical protein [Bowdeniella nasicola]
MHDLTPPAAMEERLGEILADVRDRMSTLEREVGDLGLIEAERAAITVAERLCGAHGQRLGVQLRDGRQLRGLVRDSAAGWVILQEEGQLLILAIGQLVRITGLGRASKVATKVDAARSLTSVLRRVAAQRARVRIHLHKVAFDGKILALGADYVELASADGTAMVVPLTNWYLIEVWGGQWDEN